MIIYFKYLILNLVVVEERLLCFLLQHAPYHTLTRTSDVDHKPHLSASLVYIYPIVLMHHTQRAAHHSPPSTSLIILEQYILDK